MKKDTSWEVAADWYNEHLKNEDTYHAKVVLPNLLRVLALTPDDYVLDLACGQGYFTHHFLATTPHVTAVDLSPSLAEIAAKVNPEADVHVAPAQSLDFAAEASFDVVTCVLALQNMEQLEKVFAEVARVLKPNGRFVFVLNHPTFRIPKVSSWGFEGNHAQYRRIDKYLSAFKAKIDMRPGTDTSHTWSFHYSLQDIMKSLRKSNFAITRLEEWISHRESEKGPRADAENVSRKEIPLFMMMEVKKLPSV
ncbi:hypothetical protein A3C89_00885 [Candidatus Kaiserbacteria bacterium RIFCSPHIGHO2_02_FULL_50_50]|uniref:Methyltransferase type 11 domain-containing protein n=1 Tax=Candidatus Kaiserbacteria bacterium RIFCSPHIGHO2_02_FULL_50_50 TaxID=1798492 RepID=A0A1F6DFZ9_9BACT|nr:MAG: hypothetical protein A3C89_00885 [Candidatus Kaiserbacteria bacterium RIFCSPHIGHO2_02_FULL_50_50]